MKEFPVEVISEISALTDFNDHTGARILTSATIGNKKLVEVYESIKKIQDYYGYLPHQMMELRTELDKGLFTFVKDNYSNGHDVYMEM